MDPLGVNVPTPTSKKSLFSIIAWNQQDNMVQPFGHFQWSLKHQSPDYSAL